MQLAERVYADWSTVIYILAVIVVVLVVNAILRLAMKMVRAHTDKTRHIWRDALVGAINPPLRAMVWIIGLTVIVDILTRAEHWAALSETFRPARDIAAIAVVAWALLRLVRHSEHNVLAHAQRKGRDVDATAADAIGKLVRASIVIIAVLAMMQSLGFSISGILAFGGIGGIAIGFAAQGLVANLFGGLTIYASRPFSVGEWIIIPSNDVQGEVQQIGWRATRVMGFDRRPFYVPNSLFNTAVLINHSRKTSRRIMEYIHVRYDDVDRVPAILDEANAMLAAHDGIEHEFFVFRFDSYGESTLKLFLYAFTVTTDYVEFMNVKEDILLKIAAIIRQHGGALAVPTSSVYMPEGIRLRPQPHSTDDEPMVASLTEPKAT